MHRRRARSGMVTRPVYRKVRVSHKAFLTSQHSTIARCIAGEHVGEAMQVMDAHSVHINQSIVWSLDAMRTTYRTAGQENLTNVC